MKRSSTEDRESIRFVGGKGEDALKETNFRWGKLREQKKGIVIAWIPYGSVKKHHNSSWGDPGIAALG